MLQVAWATRCDLRGCLGREIRSLKGRFPSTRFYVSLAQSPPCTSDEACSSPCAEACAKKRAGEFGTHGKNCCRSYSELLRNGVFRNLIACSRRWCRSARGETAPCSGTGCASSPRGGVRGVAPAPSPSASATAFESRCRGGASPAPSPQGSSAHHFPPQTRKEPLVGPLEVRPQSPPEPVWEGTCRLLPGFGRWAVSPGSPETVTVTEESPPTNPEPLQ